MASTRFTGPDGHVFEFEDGTPEHVRRAFIQRHYGTSAEQTNSRRSAAVSLSAPKDKRSLGERLGDVFSNTVNTGFIAEGWRAGLDDTADYIEAAQRGDQKAAFKVNDRFTLNPIRLVSRLYNSGGVLTDMTQNTQDTRAVADDWVSRERARRQEFAQASRDDPFWEAEGGFVGKTLHGAAALLGTLGGAGLDPTTYITGGTSIGAKIAVQATVAGAVDLIAQTDATGLTQDRYDVLQTVLSAGAGAVFTGAFEGVGALAKGRGNVRARIDADLRSEPVNLSQTFRDELDTADAISLPALTRDDWTFRPTQQGPVSALPMRVEPPRAERMDGPRVDGADAGPDIKPEWTKGMSPERLKAVTEHLDRLKAFIKPDQVERFVRWAGREDVNITDDPSPHWNQEIFDFDKLANEPEKFEEIVGVMAQIFKPLYDAAGDAKQTWKSVRDRQAAFGVTVSDVVKAHSDITGDNGIAAKMHALETISIQHTDHLVTKMAALEKSLNGGDMNSGLIGDVAAQLQATVMFDAMAAGAKSEIGRALNIMKMAKQRTRILNDIQGQMDLMADALGTGDLDPKSLAEALKKLREAYGSGGERALKDELRKGRHMGFGDYLSYYIVAGYLTTPATAVRNAVGSVLHASMTVGERYIAAGITSPLRRGLGGKRTSAEGVTFREANAYLFGIHQSFVDATKAGFKAFVHAAPQTDIETSVGRYAMAQPFEFNAERAAKWKKGGLMVIPDMAMTGLFGTLRTLGIRPSLGMDEFTKVMTRRMQINALAAREASYRSARLRGKEADRVYAKTLDAVTQRPTAEAFVRAKNEFEAVGADYDPAKSYAGDTRLEDAADILASVDLHEMANDYARLMAFQKTGPAVEAFEKAMKYIPIVKALYVPFLRTPLNLVRAGMVDRNPALAWITKENRAAFKTYFAALDGQEKALSRGGAEADIVMARMVSGVALMGTAAILFANGDLVGKRSPAEEQDGIKSYSIRLGGRWYQYSTLSPVAEMIGITADLYQTMRDRDLADDQSTALAGGVMGAIMNNIVNKAALQGVGDFFDLLDPSFSNTESSRGEAITKAAFKKLGDSLVPAIVRNTAQAQDPVMREASEFLDYFARNIPMLSDSLPERRDWLGLPIVRKDKDGGFIEALVQPLRVSEREDDMVRLEISALAQNDPDLLMATRPAARFNGQKITPKEHARVLAIQGQEWRDPSTGLNMHEALAELVNSEDYASYSDPRRAQSIKDTVSRYRRLATAAIKRGDYPDMDPMLDRTGTAQAQDMGEKKGWEPYRIENKARSYGVSDDALANIMSFGAD